MALGFNDLAWGGARPAAGGDNEEACRQRPRREAGHQAGHLANARTANVLGEGIDLPRGQTIHNELLNYTIATWSLPDSPVALVRFSEVYSVSPYIIMPRPKQGEPSIPYSPETGNVISCQAALRWIASQRAGGA